MRVESDDPEFLRFAKRATAGIDLDGKPLLLVAPTGCELPEKLRAAATVVEFYTLGDTESCKAATQRALEACGLPVRH